MAGEASIHNGRPRPWDSPRAKPLGLLAIGGVPASCRVPIIRRFNIEKLTCAFSHLEVAISSSIQKRYYTAGSQQHLQLQIQILRLCNERWNRSANTSLIECSKVRLEQHERLYMK